MSEEIEEEEQKKMKISVQVKPDPELQKKAKIGEEMVKTLYKALVAEGFDVEMEQLYDPDEYFAYVEALKEKKDRNKPAPSGITPISAQYSSTSGSTSGLRQEFSSYGEMIEYLREEERKGNPEAKKALDTLFEKMLRGDASIPTTELPKDVPLKKKLKLFPYHKKEEEGE